MRKGSGKKMRQRRCKLAAQNYPMNFPVQLKLRIDWSELDLFGHVNNVMFMKYVQAARVNYWEHIGLYQRFLTERKGPMLAATSCDFRKPLFYPGEVLIETRAEFVKNTSFGLHHRLLDGQGDIAAEAHDVMVMYDFIVSEKMAFPSDLRAAINALEDKDF